MKWILKLICIGSICGCSHIAFLNREQGAKASAPDVLASEPAAIIPVPTQNVAQKCEPTLVHASLTPEDLLAQKFNQGRCLEEQNLFAEASEVYRQVATSNVGKNSDSAQLKALAFFRLSFCFEALNQDEKMLASLIDAQKMFNSLPPITADLELPARTGIARARLGQTHEAQKSFLLAQSNIKNYLRNPSPLNQAQLSDILRQMGAVSLRVAKVESLATYGSSLQLAQSFLLKAVEISPTQAPLVQQELQVFYMRAYEHFQKSQDRNGTASVLGLLDRGLVETSITSSTHGFLEEWTDKFQKVSYQEYDRLSLTPEAQKRKNSPINEVRELKRVEKP